MRHPDYGCVVLQSIYALPIRLIRYIADGYKSQHFEVCAIKLIKYVNLHYIKKFCKKNCLNKSSYI